MSAEKEKKGSTSAPFLPARRRSCGAFDRYREPQGKSQCARGSLQFLIRTAILPSAEYSGGKRPPQAFTQNARRRTFRISDPAKRLVSNIVVGKSEIRVVKEIKKLQTQSQPSLLPTRYLCILRGPDRMT
jgi:hypothetical protein